MKYQNRLSNSFDSYEALQVQWVEWCHLFVANHLRRFFVWSLTRFAFKTSVDSGIDRTTVTRRRVRIKRRGKKAKRQMEKEKGLQEKNRKDKKKNQEKKSWKKNPEKEKINSSKKAKECFSCCWSVGHVQRWEWMMLIKVLERGTFGEVWIRKSTIVKKFLHSCPHNTHKNIQQARRDDMESVAYMILFILKGSLS